jgi:mitochondrial fission protein ELM1
LWIREQSGGRAKIVQIGKPSGRVEWYDLVIAGAEVVLPPLPNVLSLTLPLMQVDEASLEAAAKLWRPRLGELPRPLVGCLIGGPTEPYVYDAAMADRLLDWARRHIAETGGTPYFTTSRRTPADLVAALKAALPSEARLFAWDADASDNPYHGLLALADGFVVTGDSISMMVEALRAGKPVAIFPLRTSLVGRLDRIRRTAVRRLFAQETAGLAPALGRLLYRLRIATHTRRLFAQETAGLAPALGRLLYRLRIATHTRDFDNFHRILGNRGLAGPLCLTGSPAAGEVPDELPAIVARIEGLVAKA